MSGTTFVTLDPDVALAGCPFCGSKAALYNKEPYGHWGDPIPCTFTVTDDKLFCIDAYKLGDYKKFFNDPRTREDYFEWAPMLLTAEEYIHGKIKAGEPDVEEGFYF